MIGIGSNSVAYMIQFMPGSLQAGSFFSGILPRIGMEYIARHSAWRSSILRNMYEMSKKKVDVFLLLIPKSSSVFIPRRGNDL